MNDKPLEEMDNCSDDAEAMQNSRVVSCDQEAWLYDRLGTLARTVLAIQKSKRVDADNDVINAAISGAIEGTAIEVSRILGMEPEYMNLPKPEHYNRWNRKMYPMTFPVNPGGHR